ncbi:MAG TPA: hypothetical protein VFC18_01165 [Burkholderiales bacterium]|nr:hypothetical protein [Burkholderiales bacterium]
MNKGVICRRTVVGVNVGCLQGVSEEELSKVPITRVDGLHERWAEPPAFSSHL